MTFIIKKGNEEIAKSESKVVTFPNNVPYPIGTVVPAGAYTALNRNFWGDSASVQVPEFEIINSKKPDPIVETKIIVIPGSKTANITDNTDRLTSTDDQLNLYDGDGNLIVTSEGKSNTIQLTGLTASTTYNGYQLSWSNSYGETYKATVPEFKTTAEPLEPISPDHINLIIGITEVTVTYTGEENRTGQVFHVNDLTNSDGAPWTIVIDGLKGNTKYPAGTYKARFSKDDAMSASVNIPEFTTKDYVNPYDPTPSDLVLSDITETSVTITDKNSQGYNRSAEQIRVSKSGSTDDYQGTIGAMSITLTDLNPATEYNNAFWFHWTNPTTGKASGNVAVPKFTTSPSSVVTPVDPKTSDLSVTVSDTSAIVKDTSSGSRANEMMILYSSTWKELTEGQTGSKSVEITGLAADTDYSENTYYIAYRSTNDKESQSCSVPSFTTSGGSVEPTTPTVPVAPKDGDISVSNIQQTTATVTDTNSDSIDRSAEQLKVFLDTDRQEWTGKTGELSISLDGLEANRYYGGRLTVGYYNPTTKKSSDKVPVPRFATKG